MQESDAPREMLKCFRDQGIMISIDDFGTGYSSLSYLRKFPVDVVKIDRAFIMDMTERPEDAALVLGIVKMAQSLGMQVVAEGVETEEQLNYLESIECNKMQGFFVSPSLPADKFIHFVDDWNQQNRRTT